MAGHLLESHLMNTDDLNAAKGGLFFLHIPSMVLSHGRLNTGHSRKSLFEDFIEKRLLPMCNPFPGVRSVIVMDNAPIHQQEAH